MQFVITGLGLFLAIFLFNLVAAFAIGKVALFVAAAAIAYMIATIPRDSPKVQLTKLLVSAAITAALLLATYFQATSSSACDGYYLSRFSSQQPFGGTPQSSTTITYSTASEICQFNGFRDACRSYQKCQESWMGGSFLTLLIMLSIVALGITMGYRPRRDSINRHSGQNAPEDESTEALAHSTARRIPRSTLPTDAAPKARPKSDFPVVLEPYRESLSKMTLSELAQATSRTERGLRALLTRHGITCKNYDGAAAQEKAKVRAQQSAEPSSRDEP